MTRAGWPNLVAGAAIAIGLAASLAVTDAAPAPAAKVRTTTAGVGLREYRIALYRSHVPPGCVRFNLENLGEHGHDVRVIGPGGSVRATSAQLKPGRRLTQKARLRRRGVYRLSCTIGDHAERGMSRGCEWCGAHPRPERSTPGASPRPRMPHFA